MVEPKVNIVKDRKIQVGKEPKQFEKSYFDTDVEQTVVNEETGSWSSIKQGFIGVDEYGKPIQGLKVSVGGSNSEEEPDEGVHCQPVYGHLSRDSEENTSDKIPVLSEEIDEKTESAIGIVSSLDEEHLEMLYDNLDGTYVFDMDDFYSLVLQLFILQKASQKRK